MAVPLSAEPRMTRLVVIATRLPVLYHDDIAPEGDLHAVKIKTATLVVKLNLD